ncbi:jg16014 [Pararge aegeria aegeria]|uniref:Chloride channel protein n=4 Tax=Pararge aegeria TaxID=116150 RepID=A0A8S4SHK8_9NEOP|nr:jg16014 [Pararge aegeria aegeria]
MSNSSAQVMEETVSETASDTAQLLSSEAHPSTSNYSQLNHASDIQETAEDELQGSHGVRRRQPVQKIEPGSMNTLSAKYESLDYDTCENHLLLDEERKRGYAFIVWKDIARWVIVLLIGVITALIAFIIDICIEEFSKIKYKQLKKSVDTYVLLDKLYIPYLLWVLSNICIVFFGSMLVAYVELFCADGEYNTMAAIWFQTPEASVRSFLHDPMGSYKPWSLLVFVICYFLLSTWTFGLAVSSGLFIPNLLTGAAWGRLLAIFIQYVLPHNSINPAKYALVGAAAQLGGVVRMTISLTVIIIETTGQISNALPIIITLVVAKWTGDFFNEGIYDIHIQLAGVPLLPWEPPPLAHNIYASEVMSHPVFTLRTVENVGHIIEILRVVSYNGFPVVDPPMADDAEVTTYKRLRGMVLRSQLIVLLQNKIYNENANTTWSNFNVDMNMFRKEYPRYPSIGELEISDWEKTCTIDLRPFMNPSPYTLPHRASLPRLFRLFRALGLRHLPIVNDLNEVVGMVTRKDIASAGRSRILAGSPFCSTICITRFQFVEIFCVIMAESQMNDNTTCVVCFKTVVYYSVGECDHPVCFECSTRMRVLCQTNECPICRQDLSRVVFTDTVQPYKELRNRAFPDKLLERQYKIGFCSEAIKQAYETLLDNRCRICDRIAPFRTFSMLSDHMRKVHEQHYCDLCVKHLKIFTSERRCYTRQELAHHRRKGDLDDTSHRGHPLCEFCEERFMDADELYRHLRKEHLYCHLCDADGRNLYYASHSALAHHFRTEHYLCEEGECAGQHLTAVFRSEIDLKAHKATIHGKGMARGAARQARTLELQFNITPHPVVQRVPRDRQAQPPPVSPAPVPPPQPAINPQSDEQFPRLSAAQPAHTPLVAGPARVMRG